MSLIQLLFKFTRLKSRYIRIEFESSLTKQVKTEVEREIQVTGFSIGLSNFFQNGAELFKRWKGRFD